MAIGKGSLFSLKAQGRIGKNTLLRTVKGQTVAGAFSASHKPTTAAQSAARANYAAACAAWRGLSAADKATWASVTPQLSTNKGFSNFIEWFLEGGEVMNINDLRGVDVGYSLPIRFDGAWAPVELNPYSKWALTNADAPQFGDWFEAEINLPAGEFTLEATIQRGPWMPILKFTIDGGASFLKDLYNADISMDCWVIANDIVFATPGTHIIKVEVSDTNPLSGWWYTPISDLMFRRTA